MTNLKTPSEWEKIKRIKIKDPDGWRYDGLDWNTPIDEEDFNNRADMSTVDYRELLKPECCDQFPYCWCDKKQ